MESLMLFVVRLPDNGVTAASIQVILGFLILLAGCYCAPYHPPAPGAWDQNRLQNAVDASLLMIYLAALLATIAARYFSEELLNSMWIAGSPVLMLPAAFFGYHLRTFFAKAAGNLLVIIHHCVQGQTLTVTPHTNQPPHELHRFCCLPLQYCSYLFAKTTLPRMLEVGYFKN